MSSPTISIIVPVYNAELYLRRCIDSILLQDFNDFELLLIDDGSSDHSGEICDKYALQDSRVRTFHKINGGVSSARNTGIDHANGKYIHFVDADDWVEKNIYSVIFTLSNVADLIYFSNVEHLEDGTVVTYSMSENSYDLRNDIENVILYLKDNDAKYPFFGFTWNKIFRANIIKNNKIYFINDFAFYEDEIFTDKYCKYIKSIHTLPIPLYHYRRSLSGLTGQVLEVKNILILIENLIENNNVYSLKSLVRYEQERALSFLRKAMSVDVNQHYLIQEKLYLRKIIRMNPSINIGRKFSLINSLTNYICNLFLRLFYLVTKKTFI